MYGSHEEDLYDEWGYHTSATVMVDFLLPTGIYIPMTVERNSTIENIKKELWKEAIRYPLFSQLTSPDMYTFMYVTGIGTTEEIVQDTKRLCEQVSSRSSICMLTIPMQNDVHPRAVSYFMHQFLKFEVDLLHDLPMLKLVKRQGNLEEKRVAQEIKALAGIKNETEINKDPEKAHFRTRMRKKAIQAVSEREKMHWKELLEHHYPPSVEPALNEQTHMLREFGLVAVRYENEERKKTIKVNPEWKSHELTREALSTWESARIPLPTNNPEEYVLKGPGCEYIVGNYQLFEYKILRSALVKRVQVDDNQAQEPALLQLLHVASVRPNLPKSSFGFEQLKLTDRNLPPLASRRHNAVSLWGVDATFSVQVMRTGNINAKLDNKKLLVHMGLYHGLSTLCNTCYTNPLEAKGDNGHIWEDILYFDITVRDLPRNSRLCMAICAVDKRDARKEPKKKKTDKKQSTDVRALYATATPLFWVNMTVFDFQGILKTGKHKLKCWSWPDNLESNALNPLGVVTTNPNEEAPFIEIGMYEYNTPVEFPSFQDIMAEAARQTDISKHAEILQSASNRFLTEVGTALEKPAHEELLKDEKELIWRFRMDCRDIYSQYLSKVLSTVKWNSYKNVVQMQALLDSWRPIDPDRALELLDCQYADEKVREYAVMCLRKLKDDQLQQYLLQLVQVMKYESYLDNPLVEFLLDRAWRNRKVGHFLFWHLKSELSNVYISGRFSLILEAYLYGNITHIHCLHRQHDALLKMKSLNELVKSSEIRQNEVRTRGRAALHQCMNQESYAEALTQVECPLDPGINLESPVVRPCKVMNSKMRPLWLVFKNEDMEDGVSVIYKNGDDLRQDMLTLQIISIMDFLWKSEGLDLKMIPYGCLSTGDKTGMIEVVTHSNTIANIQKLKAGKFMASFRHETLFEWIKEKNKTPLELETAIQNFTYSCAGYCVATFVLGVGDRHSDNIMVTEKGQLFHIDFGHILGNFKTKYGIKRERVPFVLAHDFVHVINKGKTDTKEEFEKFRKLCDRAFLILRKKGHLFMTLFSLMLSSGLPELTSLEDLEYLRESLALHVTDAQATKLFKSKFNKALKDAWATSINWFFHNVAKDNT